MLLMPSRGPYHTLLCLLSVSGIGVKGKSLGRDIPRGTLFIVQPSVFSGVERSNGPLNELQVDTERSMVYITVSLFLWTLR